MRLYDKVYILKRSFLLCVEMSGRQAWADRRISKRSEESGTRKAKE